MIMRLIKPCCLVLFFLMSIASFNAAYAEDDGSDDSGQGPKEPIYHITDEIDLKPEVKIQYQKPRVVIKAVYPLLIGTDTNENIDRFNQLVAQIIQEEVNRFKEKVADLQSVQTQFKKSSVKNDLAIDFSTSVVTIKHEPIISIRFTIQGYMSGMAHPYHIHRVLNYDFAYGIPLTLTDLFKPNINYLDELSEYSNNMLYRRLKDTSLVGPGTAAAPANFANWNISPYGLLITFDEAQVAPYVYGTQSVLIPYAILKPLLDPDYPVTSCAKSRWACLQRNVLTGGLIDEAAATPLRSQGSNA